MRTAILMAMLTIVALLATACAAQTATPGRASPTNPPAAGALDGSSWILTTLNGQPALGGTTVTLNFAGGRVAGSDGCNTYNTTYTADGSNIKISSPIATTMMACPDAIMAQATAYLAALEQAATYRIEGDQLTLLDAGGAELAVFTAQSSELAGTAWDVISYNNGQQAVVSVMLGTQITAVFDPDGNLSGSAGCNNYTASYQTDGNNISIGPAAATRMFCAEPEGVMDQEVQYLTALQTAATYRIDGSQMEMRTADGALVATFQRAAP